MSVVRRLDRCRRQPSCREGRRRWVVVVALIAALVAVPVAVAAAPVGTPHIEPGALRDRMLASTGQAYQGYVESRGSVVLPDLPQLGDVAKRLGGTTSLRVWHGGPRAWRVAVLDPVGEQDVFRTETGTYTWDYSRNLWTETVGEPQVRAPQAADLLPPELARRLVADAGPGAALRTLPARRVAGVAAAGLRVVPTDPDTTIDRIDVWADPATGLPLMVDVAGAFTSRFLDVSTRAPDAGVVQPRADGSSAFTSTTSSEVTSALNSVARASLPGSLAGRARVPGPVSAVAAYGTGLSRIVVVAVPGRLGERTLNALRDAGATPAASGYLLRSAVLTVVVSRPGRRTFLVIGFVTPQVLTTAAAELR